jgi:hypothetical protein
MPDPISTGLEYLARGQSYSYALFLGQAGGMHICGLMVNSVDYRPMFASVSAALLALGVGGTALLFRSCGVAYA